MTELGDQLTPKEEACLDRMQNILREMKKQRLAFQECIEGQLAKLMELLQKQSQRQHITIPTDQELESLRTLKQRWEDSTTKQLRWSGCFFKEPCRHGGHDQASSDGHGSVHGGENEWTIREGLWVVANEHLLTNDMWKENTVMQTMVVATTKCGSSSSVKVKQTATARTPYVGSIVKLMKEAKATLSLYQLVLLQQARPNWIITKKACRQKLKEIGSVWL